MASQSPRVFALVFSNRPFPTILERNRLTKTRIKLYQIQSVGSSAKHYLQYSGDVFHVVRIKITRKCIVDLRGIAQKQKYNVVNKYLKTLTLCRVEVGILSWFTNVNNWVWLNVHCPRLSACLSALKNCCKFFRTFFCALTVCMFSRFWHRQEIVESLLLVKHLFTASYLNQITSHRTSYPSIQIHVG